MLKIFLSLTDEKYKTMKTIIEKLFDENVISIELSEDKKTVECVDGCDFYYKKKLTKDELKKLIEELGELLNKME